VTVLLPVPTGRVFIDTSAYYAAINYRDADHEPAARWMQGLVEARHRLVTTNFVLAELHALAPTRLDRRAAAQVLATVDSSPLTTIVRVAARDERRARQIISNYTDKDFSLTDATSFAVMERLRIPQAFTLDKNFSQFGWLVLDLTGHS
jgi:predicted nucleic acid-binding protein